MDEMPIRLKLHPAVKCSQPLGPAKHTPAAGSDLSVRLEASRVMPRSVGAEGFSLIEMLIVIAIIALIAAISLGVFVAAPERARVRGTEALIVKLDAKLSQKLREFEQRQSSIAPIAQDTTLSSVGSSPTVPNPRRAQVIALVRSMRQEFPELFVIDKTRSSDNKDNDGDGLIDETSTDEILAGQWNPMDVNNDGTPDQPPGTLPASAVTFLRCMERAFVDSDKVRIRPGFTTGPKFEDAHTPFTARAECLYMILTSCGTDRAEFSSEEIKDTDEDGLPEFVDRWGNPIQFFLWPSYYSSPMQQPGAETDLNDPQQLLTEIHSPPVATDWWATNNRPAFERLFYPLTHFVPATSKAQPKGFRAYPLIVSAGPDQGFGFRGIPAGYSKLTAGSMGADNIWGTFDDTAPVGLMLSVGPDGKPATPSDSPTLKGDDDEPLISAAMRITDPNVEGYTMDQDNIDNHHIRIK